MGAKRNKISNSSISIVTGIKEKKTPFVLLILNLEAIASSVRPLRPATDGRPKRGRSYRCSRARSVTVTS